MFQSNASVGRPPQSIAVPLCSRRATSPIQPAFTTVGYGALATQIDFDTDLSTYRRFGALQARTLLYIQAEISSLENRLLDLDKEADASPDLDERSDELLQAQAWLLSLKPPEEGAWRSLQNLVRSRQYVVQAEAAFLSQFNKSDLVALVPREEREVLSKFLEKRAFCLFQTKDDLAHRATSNLEVFSHTRIRTFVRILTILVSTLLPVLSIVVLYYVHSQTVRLGCIVLFTGFCSVVLALITNARNVEIVSVAAAYAAVQVVFVSGNLGPQ